MTKPQTAWSPTDDQMNYEVGPVLSDITDQLQQLQKDLDCPDSFIDGLVENIASYWKL